MIRKRTVILIFLVLLLLTSTSLSEDENDLGYQIYSDQNVLLLVPDEALESGYADVQMAINQIHETESISLFNLEEIKTYLNEKEVHLFELNLISDNTNVSLSGCAILVLGKDNGLLYRFDQDKNRFVQQSESLLSDLPGAFDIADTGLFLWITEDEQDQFIQTLSSSEMSEGDRTSYISLINKELGLESYIIFVNEKNPSKNITADLSIDGNKYINNFYFDHVLEEIYGGSDWENVEQQEKANLFTDYLLSTFETEASEDEALKLVKERWKRWLYDIYDPSYDLTKSSPSTTYGDPDLLDWMKESAGSSFHNSYSGIEKNGDDGLILDLNYSYLENGVDYSNIISDLTKTATAVSEGDANTDRAYDIEITADAQATIKAPVALIFQIQTSWQMFDLNHANALKGNGQTSVGTGMMNDELANLFTIKKALLRLIEYAEEKYPGNNLLIGITEVQHNGSSSMIQTTVNNEKIYVSNNAQMLIDGLYGWDTFGNCEHVHYDNNTLKSVLSSLESNIKDWKDFYGTEIQYDQIEKAVIAIGGPTENSSSTQGYGCVLPWSDFMSSKIDQVYGITVNQGVPLNSDGIVSWMDIAANNGTPYSAESGGSGFNAKFTATNEDGLFESFVQILETEMKKKSISLNLDSSEDENGNTILGHSEIYAENMTIYDTVSDEFYLNEDSPVKAVLYDENGTVLREKVLWPLENTEDYSVYIDEATADEVIETADGLRILKHQDQTTELIYTFQEPVYSLQSARLCFQVLARDDYLGSNNVRTNVGTAKAEYEHTVRDQQGNILKVESYEVSGWDTPEVNVPIRFDVCDGGKSILYVGEEINLADLAGDIVLDAQDRAERYDQINGRLSYYWTLPDGTSIELGSVVIEDGKIVESEFPSLDYLFTANQADEFKPELSIIFSPEESTDSVRVGVSALEKTGSVTVEALEETNNFYVRKIWAFSNPKTDAIEFYLMQNDVPYKDPSDTGAQSYTVYTLGKGNTDDSWEMYFSLPSVYEENGERKKYDYTVVELTSIPNYTVSYSYGDEQKDETSYKAEISIGFTLANDLTNRGFEFTYQIGNEEIVYVIEPSNTKYSKNTYYPIPVDEHYTALIDGELPKISLISFKSFETDNKTGAKKNETELYAVSSPKVSLSVKSEKVIDQIKVTDYYTITNKPGITLPETGSFFTFLGTAGLILMGLAFITYRKSRNSSADSNS